MNLNIIGNWIKNMSSRELSEMTPEQITDGIKNTLLNIPEVKDAIDLKKEVSKITGKECDLVTELYIYIDNLKMELTSLKSEIKNLSKKPEKPPKIKAQIIPEGESKPKEE